MRVGELLDELRVGILNDRTTRVSGSSDYLWTDARLISYMNEAQRRFAVNGLVIRDGSTAEATTVTLVAGQTTYPLHASVLAVISAKLETENYDLQRAGHSSLSGYRQPAESFFDAASWSQADPGLPVGFSTDEAMSPDDYDSFGSVTLRVYPAPRDEDAGKVIRLRVIRKAIEDMKASNPTATPEIPADHHIEMLDWAAYLALRIVDDDAGAPKRAEEFAASFEVSVRKARVEAMRKLFAPTAWGFGRNGFSWTP